MEEIRWKQHGYMNLLVLRRIQMKCCCKLKRNEDYNELPRQSLSFINVFFIFIDFFFFLFHRLGARASFCIWIFKWNLFCSVFSHFQRRQIIAHIYIPILEFQIYILYVTYYTLNFNTNESWNLEFLNL